MIVLAPIVLAPEALARLKEIKRCTASGVLRRPDDWKVCESCGRLVRADRSFCPFCHAYRFASDEVSILAAATRDLARELPAVIPRWLTEPLQTLGEMAPEK